MRCAFSTTVPRQTMARTTCTTGPRRVVRDWSTETGVDKCAARIRSALAWTITLAAPTRLKPGASSATRPGGRSETNSASFETSGTFTGPPDRLQAHHPRRHPRLHPRHLPRRQAHRHPRRHRKARCRRRPRPPRPHRPRLQRPRPHRRRARPGRREGCTRAAPTLLRVRVRVGAGVGAWAWAWAWARLGRRVRLGLGWLKNERTNHG